MENTDQYIKDPISGALINMNYNDYQKILANRAQRKKEIEKDIELDQLRIEIAELKEMLQGLVRS